MSAAKHNNPSALSRKCTDSTNSASFANHVLSHYNLVRTIPDTQYAAKDARVWTNRGKWQEQMSEDELPEPWLRGTLTEIPAVPRAVVQALQLAKEDIERWCGDLTDEQLNARPAGIASVAFHIRHIARSTDRLLTYAEGNPLNAVQIAAMKTELDAQASRSELFDELASALAKSQVRIRAFSAAQLESPRKVGKKELPTTIGGLLVHVADHTQRHVGQAVTTAKIVAHIH
jgi:uncharacterized damage-inducible protein DinB